MNDFIEQQVLEDILSDCEKTLTLMQSCVNKGDPSRAIAIAVSHTHDTHDGHRFITDSPDYWFCVSLSFLLENDLQAALNIWGQVLDARSDVSAIMRGDFLCDVALYYIRHRRPKEAFAFLKKIGTAYDQDRNRQAKLLMINARHLAITSNSREAVSLLLQAVLLFESLDGNVNQQWLLNARIHLVLHAGKLGYRQIVRYAYDGIGKSMPRPSSKKLFMAGLIRYGGSPVARAVGKVFA